MNDDRDNSLQQCLINKYRKILFCWPAKICSGDLYQYQCENSVDLELLSYLLEKRTNLFRRARLYRGYHWRRPCSLRHFLSFSVSATHTDQIHTSGKFADHLLNKMAIISNIRIRLDLVKHLIIKISERSFTQRFDDSMSSFSSEKRIKLTT